MWRQVETSYHGRHVHVHMLPPFPLPFHSSPSPSLPLLSSPSLSLLLFASLSPPSLSQESYALLAKFQVHVAKEEVEKVDTFRYAWEKLLALSVRW